MEQVTTRDRFLELCAGESEARGKTGWLRPYVREIIYPPPHLIAWVGPCTLGKAVAIHRTAMAEFGANYTEAVGGAFVAHHCCMVDPENITWPDRDSDPPDPGDRLQPWFDTPQELMQWSDPNAFDSDAQLLILAIKQMTGFIFPEEADLYPEAPKTLAEAKALWPTRHLWVKGLFFHAPEAALCICTRISEADRVLAMSLSMNSDKLDAQGNEAAFMGHLAAACLRTGPLGERLCTYDDIKLMQWGAANAVYRLAHRAGRGADSEAGVRFLRRPEEPVVPDPGDGSREGVVVHEAPGEDTTPTGRSDA